ncbi:MAG: DUF92 domain-containing protein [Candidatus Helarchaeota archaeon]
MTLILALLNPLFFWIHVIIGAIVVGLFGAVSIKAKIVDVSGLIAGFIVGLGVWVFGNGAWFVMILLFHLVAAAFTKYKYERKKQSGLAQEKGGARGWPNVFANGGVPLIFLFIGDISYLFLQNSDIIAFCFFGFLGGICTMIADTLGTEIGLLAKSKPRLITHLSRTVEPGTSGGVTMLGELGGILGASIVSGAGLVIITVQKFLGLPFIVLPLFGLEILLIGIIAGLGGCAVDSIIGATVQGIFQCQGDCGKITEKRNHCGVPAKHLRGMKIFDNNVVNFVAALSGGIIAALLSLILIILW